MELRTISCVHCFLSPQCQKATHPLLSPQSFLQQPLDQRLLLEQHLQPQPQQELEPQILLLQELQPQLVLELHLWLPQPEPESRFAEQTQQGQALVIHGDSRPEPPLLFPVERGGSEGAVGCARLCAPL